MKIKKYEEYTLMNEFFSFSKKPIDKAIMEFEMIINNLPNDYDELYTDIITDLNSYKKLNEEKIVTKILELSNKILNEISDIFDCLSIKKQLEDFIYKLERDFKIIELLTDSEETHTTIEPEIIHVPTKPKHKNVKDFHNWSTIDIKPIVMVDTFESKRNAKLDI